MDVYSAHHYSECITSWLNENKHLKGAKGRLATVLGVHPSYLSRVLKKEVDLLPHQLFNLASSWGLDENEKSYLLNLLEISRSPTKSLSAFYKRKNQELRENIDSIYIEKESVENIEEMAFYYSRWEFMAIHILSHISQYQQISFLSKVLLIPEEGLYEMILILQKLGFVEFDNENKKIHPKKKSLHLNKDFSITPGIHQSWRMKTAFEIGRRKKENLHFSSLYSTTKEGFHLFKLKIREILNEINQDNLEMPNEEAVFLGVDLFCLDGENEK